MVKLNYKCPKQRFAIVAASPKISLINAKLGNASLYCRVERKETRRKNAEQHYSPTVITAKVGRISDKNTDKQLYLQDKRAVLQFHGNYSRLRLKL